MAFEPIRGQTTESVTHGQCDGRPTVTFPAAEHHRLLAGTMGVSNLPGVATQQCTGWESNLRPLDHKSNALPLQHRATRKTTKNIFGKKR